MPAWTRIERHKDGYLMPRQLHIRDEIVGASIKAKLNRLETLPNEPSSHHLRRTMSSKMSLFIGPTKFRTRDIDTDHFSLSLLNALDFPELHLLTLLSEILWLAPHRWPSKRIPIFSLTLHEMVRTCIGSLLDKPNYWQSQHHQCGAVCGNEAFRISFEVAVPTGSNI